MPQHIQQKDATHRFAQTSKATGDQGAYTGPVHHSAWTHTWHGPSAHNTAHAYTDPHGAHTTWHPCFDMFRRWTCMAPLRACMLPFSTHVLHLDLHEPHSMQTRSHCNVHCMEQLLRMWTCRENPCTDCYPAPQVDPYKLEYGPAWPICTALAHTCPLPSPCALRNLLRMWTRTPLHPTLQTPTTTCCLPMSNPCDYSTPYGPTCHPTYLTRNTIHTRMRNRRETNPHTITPNGHLFSLLCTSTREFLFL